MPVVEADGRLRGDGVSRAPARCPGASAEETGTLLRWIERPGTRLVRSTAPWSSPAAGAGRWRPFMKAADVARSTIGADATAGDIASRDMVTAIVLIDVEADRIPEAAQEIADLPGVDQVYSCAGDVDLVAVSGGLPTRGDRRSGARAHLQGARRAAHRHPHRVPRVLRAGTPTTPSRSACRHDRAPAQPGQALAASDVSLIQAG